MKKAQDIFRLVLVATALTFLAQKTIAEVQMNVGGKHLPAQGTVRVLVVFAQFKDDQQDPTNWNWPSGQLPPWSDQLFATEAAARYPEWTVSDYYAQMSNGTYHVLGDVYPKLVTTTRTSDEYAQYKMTFSDINKEILSTIDPDVDFSKYDRWSITKYNNRVYMTEGRDGAAEMIMIVFRSVPNKPFGSTTVRTALGYQWSAIAMLGFNGHFISNEGVSVKTGFPGSGITMTNGLLYSHAKVVAILAHEYGHYLFEVHHFETRGGLGLMGGAGPAMNSYERARLGYITLRDVTFDQMQEVDDYVTTGVAYRIPVGGDEFFLVENRQRLSVYDGLGERGEEVKQYGAGIYIYHVIGESVNNLDLESAAGNWDWTVQRWFANPWDESMILPLIVRSTPNTRGQDALDGFVVDGRMYFKDFVPHPTKDSVLYTGASQGSQEDAFVVGGNDTFAPWTNPSSHRANGATSGVVVRLLEQNGPRVRAWFSLNGSGSVTSVGGQSNAAGVPEEMELSQNFPNPFNPTTTIAFQLPQSTKVRLTVYNVLGEVVTTLANETRQAGRHEVKWEGTNQQGQAVASGLYVYALETEQYRIVKRMNLVK